VADLMPQMQKRTSLRDSLPQFVLVGAGVAIVYTLTVVFHAH